MKKVVVFLIISLVWCACSERNEPSSQQGDDGKEQQEELSEIKPRYVVETYQKYIWVDETSAYKDLLGRSTRTVYERDVNPQYKKSYSVYQNDVLQYVISYTNIGDGEYGKYTYCSESYKELLGKAADTTYYYDSDRTMTRETRTGNTRILYKYDSQERLISQTQYFYNELSLTSEYTYKGLIRYGQSKFYSNNSLQYLTTDTCEYTDDRFAFVKRSSTLQTYIGKEQLYDNVYTIRDGEVGPYGITKLEIKTTFTNRDGSKSTNINFVRNNWADEFHYTGENEYYEDGEKIYVLQTKYQYIR